MAFSELPGFKDHFGKEMVRIRNHVGNAYTVPEIATEAALNALKHVTFVAQSNRTFTGELADQIDHLTQVVYESEVYKKLDARLDGI